MTSPHEMVTTGTADPSGSAATPDVPARPNGGAPAALGPGACVARLLCDRHRQDAVALTVVDADLHPRTVTYGRLRERSARLATGLAGLGVGRGDRVAAVMGKGEDLVVTALAVWRLGAVYVPLFTAFAPAAIEMRIAGSGAKVVVCDQAQRPKLEPGRGLPTGPGRPVVVTTGEPALDTDVPFAPLAAAAPQEEPVAVGGDGIMVELFTSGTAGMPKGVLVPVRALDAFAVYQEYGLDHRSDDVFWNAADPGWAYGLYYAVLGPLLLGRSTLLLRAPFSPAVTWAVLERFGVTNFAAGPTVYRALRADDTPVPRGLALRRCSSAGEPLGTDVPKWAEAALRVPVRDHYGQTELGMAAADAWHPALATPARPGSMGRALPGWRLAVLRHGTDEPAAPGEPGRLAVELEHSPLMWFTGYRDAPDRTAERFTADGRWYLTGDTAVMDPDGFLTFAARDDDIILMSGYRIGPHEVESSLEQHPAVAEAAVTPAPDELRGQIVVAHVVLRPGTEPTPALAADLKAHVKHHLSAHAYPREIRFVPALPRTASGKLQRFVLRDRRPD